MNKNVIIVDDSKLSRMHLRGIVLRNRPDWTVSEAANAAELFQNLDKSTIHIAIIDYNMPGMNGLDAAVEVRQRHPDVHIAMVTANAQDAVVSGIRALGAAFLPKPVDEEQIKHFLSSTLLPRRPAAAP